MLILTDEKIPVWFTAHSDSNLTPGDTHASVKSRLYAVIAEEGNYIF